MVDLAIRRLLEWISLFILIMLAVVVVIAVIFRYSGSSLVWYDEIASVLLAWLTYFGAALAALNRSHLGFTGFLRSLPPVQRLAAFWAGEAVVYAFLGTCAYAGWYVLSVFGEETLVSLPIPLSLTQSVIPIGFILFAIGQLTSTRREISSLFEMNEEARGGDPV